MKTTTTVYIAEISGGDLINDLADGSQAWATWSIGLCTAALGLMLLGKLAQFIIDSIRG